MRFCIPWGHNIELITKLKNPLQRLSYAQQTTASGCSLVKEFFELGKPVAAICHGPWTLIDAGVVRGRRLTSWPSLKTDLANAGAKWTDAEVVVDDGLVSSRKPQDIPAFNREMIKLFEQGLRAV